LATVGVLLGLQSCGEGVDVIVEGQLSLGAADSSQASDGSAGEAVCLAGECG
jgi:hypothetical protein